MGAADVSRDQFALINIVGMHCHKCENAIRRALAAHPGVNEVEVDFPSGLASILYERGSVSIDVLVQSVSAAGYTPAGVAQGAVDLSTC